MRLSRVEALQGAIRRLKVNSADRLYLEKELFNIQAGIRGEQRLHKKIIEFYFPSGYEIIWNVNLSLNAWPVQIDGLLLTKNVAVIIESKNISGELHFDNITGEFYRLDLSGAKAVMDNPAIQVEKHIRFMKAWFAEHGIRLAVDGLLVFTALQSELKNLPKTTYTCRRHHMIELLFNIIEEYKPSTTAQTSLNDLRKLIESKQTPYLQKPIALHYSIKPELFSRGIYCSQCETPTVKKHYRSWRCSQCDLICDDAPRRAVLEYFSLFGKPASNQEIRSFTGIEDRHVMKRLLADKSFIMDGRNRQSRYSPGEKELEME